jgi:hypothetical protein
MVVASHLDAGIAGLAEVKPPHDQWRMTGQHPYKMSLALPYNPWGHLT